MPQKLHWASDVGTYDKMQNYTEGFTHKHYLLADSR